MVENARGLLPALVEAALVSRLLLLHSRCRTTTHERSSMHPTTSATASGPPPNDDGLSPVEASDERGKCSACGEYVAVVGEDLDCDLVGAGAKVSS